MNEFRSKEFFTLAKLGQLLQEKQENTVIGLTKISKLSQKFPMIRHFFIGRHLEKNNTLQPLETSTEVATTSQDSLTTKPGFQETNIASEQPKGVVDLQKLRTGEYSLPEYALSDLEQVVALGDLDTPGSSESGGFKSTESKDSKKHKANWSSQVLQIAFLRSEIDPADYAEHAALSSAENLVRLLIKEKVPESNNLVKSGEILSDHHVLEYLQHLLTSTSIDEVREWLKKNIKIGIDEYFKVQNNELYIKKVLVYFTKLLTLSGQESVNMAENQEYITALAKASISTSLPRIQSSILATAKGTNKPYPPSRLQ